MGKLSTPPANSGQLSHLEQGVLGLIDKAEVIAFLQTLIRQRSDHPPGNCRGAIEAVAQKLAEAGVAFDVKAQRDLQPSLLATLPGSSLSPILMYHAHIDTVPAGELARWSIDPFAGEIKDGRIYGRGAGDDKGSVTAQVMALVTLARAGVSLNGCLQVAVVADEESGGLVGTKWLHDAGVLAPHYLVVGEQTNNRVAIGERVACGIDLTIFGKSAHGAMPWAGENAVLKAARALTWLQDKLFPQLQAKAVPFLPPPTLNVGKIHGGIQWSIVPERCKVEMDRRLIPGETREMAIAEIQELLDEFNETVEPLRYELFSSGEVAPNINTPPDEPFVVTANEALQAMCGEARHLTGYVQTSDGRWFAGDGIPIIIFGPSDPAVAHAADEHISIEQLIEATRFLTLFALRWLNN
jgi:acetylornithine deacetylase/succinyl-diaminopimelate desuccinylase family protein